MRHTVTIVWGGPAVVSARLFRFANGSWVAHPRARDEFPLREPMSTLELWAAATSTVHRIGDRWFDRMRRTGHHDRLDDIDRFAALGAKRVRFPVAWSRVTAHAGACGDWRWSDVRLGRLAELDLAAIVGLLDGNVPTHVAADAPDFVARFADYAGEVVERYPWIEDWTPIHAPQTTARNCVLTGLWHPHTRDFAAYLRSVVRSASAIAAAMRRIRVVVPHARLVQTERIGRVSSTPALTRQHRIANEMRWLALDLLCGRVDAEHPLRARLEATGVAAGELDALVVQPCPPDVIGIDYDLASDRFLDDRLEHHPAHAWTGDGEVAFADVEVVRMGAHAIAGHRAVLDDAWRRFRRPLALTDVHLGGPREAQMRWLWDAWCAAAEARVAGVDVRAVTVSAAFGSVVPHGPPNEDLARYEAGAYDVRANVPRPTALASTARELAEGRTPDHPLLATRGFWSAPASVSRVALTKLARPLLVAGASRIADRFTEACARRGIVTTRMARLERSGDGSALPGDPWAVIALHDGPAPARRGQVDGVPGLVALALACEQRGLPFVTLSSDLVFDGAASRPYVESDPAQPVTVAGRLRRRLERRIQAVAPSAFIVRVGPLLDPQDPDDALARILAALVEGSRVRLPDDEVVSPSFVPELVDTVLDLLVDGMEGIWHGTNAGALSLHQLARAAALRAGVPTTTLEAGASLHSWGAEVRPGMRALASERARTMCTIDTAIAAYIGTMTAQLHASPRPRATTAA